MRYVIQTAIEYNKYGQLDLSVDNPELNHIDVSSCKALSHYIDQVSAAQNTPVLMGGYLEHRAIYDRSDTFSGDANRRNIHLGLDVWAPYGTPVLAANDGIVHSIADNKGLGNYGPTIILTHQIQGVQLYTLYGHLSESSLEDISIGDAISGGQVIGSLGSPSVNGDYPPHLHFQVIKDIGHYRGDYPGVASKSDIAYYSQNCPDPLLFLGRLS